MNKHADAQWLWWDWPCVGLARVNGLLREN